MKLNDSKIALHASRLFFYLAVVSCFGLNGLGVRAQNSEILSRKPPVVRTFDPGKNESNTSTLFVQVEELVARASPGWDPAYDRNLNLYSAEYIYPGRFPARPQTVVFTFISKGKSKGTATFSITADNSLIHEGAVAVVERAGTNGQLKITLPTDIFLRMAQSKKVEFKIRATTYENSYKLKDYQRKCLASLAATIK